LTLQSLDVFAFCFDVGLPRQFGVEVKAQISSRVGQGDQLIPEGYWEVAAGSQSEVDTNGFNFVHLDFPPVGGLTDGIDG